ncbi:MAG: hypothetical protein ACTSO9_06595 [Candidatus Helarchaeota archaeon]
MWDEHARFYRMVLHPQVQVIILRVLIEDLDTSHNTPILFITALFTFEGLIFIIINWLSF